jgi:hypothetical protein
MKHKFAKTWNSNRFSQIVLIKGQNDEGEPCITFFFKPDGHGVCNFVIGFQDDTNAEAKVNEAFDKIVLREAIEIIDGYLGHVGAASH